MFASHIYCFRVQTKGALAAAAAASAVAAQVARGRGRAALARGAFVSAAAPGYVTPGSYNCESFFLFLLRNLFWLECRMTNMLKNAAWS